MEENDIKYCLLSRKGGGGATVAATSQALIVGVWDKDVLMSTDLNQNTGDCTDRVLNVAKKLKEAGF